jgi:hypothetical protein
VPVGPWAKLLVILNTLLVRSRRRVASARRGGLDTKGDLERAGSPARQLGRIPPTMGGRPVKRWRQRSTSPGAMSSVSTRLHRRCSECSKRAKACPVPAQPGEARATTLALGALPGGKFSRGKPKAARHGGDSAVARPRARTAKGSRVVCASRRPRNGVARGVAKRPRVKRRPRSTDLRGSGANLNARARRRGRAHATPERQNRESGCSMSHAALARDLRCRRRRGRMGSLPQDIVRA